MYINNLKEAPLNDVLDKLRGKGWLVYFSGYDDYKDKFVDFHDRYELWEVSPESLFMEFVTDTYQEFNEKIMPLCHDLLGEVWEKKGDKYIAEVNEGHRIGDFVAPKRIDETKYLMRFVPDDIIDYIYGLPGFSIIFGHEDIVPLLIDNDTFSEEDLQKISSYTLYKISDQFYDLTDNVCKSFISDSINKWKVKKIEELGLELQDVDKLD